MMEHFLVTYSQDILNLAEGFVILMLALRIRRLERKVL